MYRECRYMGAEMVIQVKKWGNSASVRIPASVMAAAALRIDQEVDVREEGGRIIIEPITAPTYDLDRLLQAMVPNSFPDTIDFGPEVGNEAW
jgi:antitoxin MazE